MRAMIAPVMALATGPVMAQGLVCDPAFFCNVSDNRCFAAPGLDEEGADYVEDPMGAAPRIYVSEGTWAAAERREGQGTLSWEAMTAEGQSVILTVEQSTGAYTMMRRDAGEDGRLWYATGTCEDRP
jgi:hypothetical protein